MNGLPDLGRPSRRQLVQGMGVAGAALLAGCAPLPFQRPVQKQQTIRRIGVLAFSSPERSSPFLEAFRISLRDLGYVEGHNVTIEARYGEGIVERLPALAVELVGLGAEVILAQTSAAAIAAKEASTTVPIVFVETGNPIGTGLVASLARPGGHLTGLAGFGPELAAKRLELLRGIAPWISHVGVLRTPTPANEFEWTETQDAAQALGLTLRLFEIRSLNDWGDALAAMTREPPHALLMLTGSGIARAEIMEFAAQRRLPTMTPDREFVAAGALMAYGPSIGDMWRRAAYYVDQILKGAKPADLPVEQPREFEFVINLHTARALDLSLPASVLIFATDAIR